MQGKWIATFVAMTALLTASTALACPGKKMKYMGKCLDPGEVKKLKEAERNKAVKKKAKRPTKKKQPQVKKPPMTWIYSKPAKVSFSRSEVTVGQYRACVRAGVCKRKTYITKTDNKYCNWGHQGRDRHPMNCVDWYGAAAFCRWAGGRLPRSKEWFAEASSGGTRPYPWGKKKATCARVIMDDGGWGCGKRSTWPVCSKTAGKSVSGLCDMIGNVWEWTTKADGSTRVLRGGGWTSKNQGDLRSSTNVEFGPNGRINSLQGFRCARSSR